MHAPYERLLNENFTIRSSKNKNNNSNHADRQYYDHKTPAEHVKARSHKSSAIPSAFSVGNKSGNNVVCDARTQDAYDRRNSLCGNNNNYNKWRRLVCANTFDNYSNTDADSQNDDSNNRNNEQSYNKAGLSTVAFRKQFINGYQAKNTVSNITCGRKRKRVRFAA